MMSLAAIATLICGGQVGSGSPPPTWAHPVREIMQTHCVSCHHTNGPAPFSLARYEDVAPRAAFVAEVTSQHIMPPWLPRPGEVELRDHRGRTLLISIGAQIVLGIAAVAAVMMRPEAGTTADVPAWEVLLTSAHQANGALLLALSLLLVAWYHHAFEPPSKVPA